MLANILLLYMYYDNFENEEHDSIEGGRIFIATMFYIQR